MKWMNNYQKYEEVVKKNEQVAGAVTSEVNNSYYK